MSDDDNDDEHGNIGEERRSAYVKWNGKTIALGTFSAEEADSRRELAKQITQQWRETMNPRPDIEWAKRKLEELKVREVNDKPGRRKLDDVSKGIRATKRNKLNSQSSKTQLNQPTSGKRNLNSDDGQRHHTDGITAQKRMLHSFEMPVDHSSRLSHRDRLSFPATHISPHINPENHSSRYAIHKPNQNTPFYQRDRIHDITIPNERQGVIATRCYKYLQNHLEYLLEELRQTNYLLGMYRNQEREERLLRMRSTTPFDAAAQISDGRSRGIETIPSSRFSSRKSHPPMYGQDIEQYYPRRTMNNSPGNDRMSIPNMKLPSPVNSPRSSRRDKSRSYSAEVYEQIPSINMPPLGSGKRNDLDVSAADSLLLMHSQKDKDCSTSSPQLFEKLNDSNPENNEETLTRV